MQKKQRKLARAISKTILRKINEDWGASSLTAIFCNEIMSQMTERTLDGFTHLTYHCLASMCGSYAESNDSHFAKALQYLCSPRIGLLDLRYELIDDAGGVYPVSSDEIRKAQIVSLLVHPVTGEEIEDYKEKVFVYFRLSVVKA